MLTSLAACMKESVNRIADAYDWKRAHYAAHPDEFSTKTRGDIKFTIDDSDIPRSMKYAVQMAIDSAASTILPKNTELFMDGQDNGLFVQLKSEKGFSAKIEDMPETFPRHQVLAKLNDALKELEGGWREVPGSSDRIVRSIAKGTALPTEGSHQRSLVKEFKIQQENPPVPLVMLMGLAKKHFPDQEEHLSLYAPGAQGSMFLGDAGFVMKDGKWTASFTKTDQVRDRNTDNALAMLGVAIESKGAAQAN